MGLECQIFIQDSKEGVYRPGETVIGSLNYCIDKPTKYKSIDVSFVGIGVCQWPLTDETATRSNEEEFVNINKNLFRIGRDEELQFFGKYVQTFEFIVPEDIPTSMNNSICVIKYKVIATFVKLKNLKIKRFDAEVTVYGYVSPCSPEPQEFYLLEDFVGPTSVNNFCVKAEIDRTFVTPGENFTLTFTVDNNADVPIVIEAELKKCFTYISAGGQSTWNHAETVDTTKCQSPAIKANSKKEMQFIVPTLPSLYSIQNSKILIGDYKVRVTAKVPLSNIIKSVDIPVVIGERKDLHGAAAYGIEEDPPSYSE